MQIPDDANRVFWHSRRGMLELDLLLMPFARKDYPQLPADEQALYRRLLGFEDQQLLAWLMGHETPEDADLQRIIQRILDNPRPVD